LPLKEVGDIKVCWPLTVNEADLALMHRMDRIRGTRLPTHGWLVRMLRRKSVVIERKRVSSWSHRIDVQSFYPKPNTIRKHAVYKIWPYRLRNWKIEHTNEPLDLAIRRTLAKIVSLRISTWNLGNPIIWSRLGACRISVCPSVLRGESISGLVSNGAIAQRHV
jgi:hypothetical protein